MSDIETFLKRQNENKTMTISPEYAEELGRQIDELEAENERLREALAAASPDQPLAHNARWTLQESVIDKEADKEVARYNASSLESIHWR